MKSKDDRFTPIDRWKDWSRAFGPFDLDPCGHPDSPVSRAIGRIYTQKENGFTQVWSGHRAWVNPPFSDIEPWILKAFREVSLGCGLVVMLVPANRTEQPWWQRYVEPFRVGGWHQPHPLVSLDVHFIRGRVKFGTPADPECKRPKNRPQFGCALLRLTPKTEAQNGEAARSAEGFFPTESWKFERTGRCEAHPGGGARERQEAGGCESRP